MYQLLTFKNPIPSCNIYGLKYNKESNSWEYIYCLNTPSELTNNEGQEPLIIYEYISDLILKEDNLPEFSVNLKVNSLNEYIEYLNKQREADISYRKEWLKKNPDAEPNLIHLKKKDYNFAELKDLNINFIAELYKINDDEENYNDEYSVFTGR